MEQSEPSFTVVLSSDENLAFFPNNCQHDFYNILHKPLKCFNNLYEVAISDIFINKSPLRQLFNNQKPGQLFISVGKIDTTKIAINRDPSMRLHKWLAYLTQQFTQNNLSTISFSFLLNSKSKITKISFENQSSYDVVVFPKT